MPFLPRITRIKRAARQLLARSPSAAPQEPPRLPPELVVYAIGDVHGHADLLDVMLEAVRADAATLAPTAAPVLVLLGDYVDRGPDSAGVLDRLAGGLDLPGFTVRLLMGNHEQAMLDFLDRPAGGATWLEFGGVETLASYGIQASVGSRAPDRLRALRDRLAAALPPAHLALLRRLEPMAVYGDYAFVHAGIHPRRPLDRQRLDDLLWIRQPFLTSRRRHEKMIVHGHTVVPAVERHPNRIAVDTGAYASGLLSAVACSDADVRIIGVSRR